MAEVKIVGRGVDTLVLNVCYADKQFQPIKQELDANLQEVLSSLQDEARINEAAVMTYWAFKDFNLFMQPKGSRGQWRWILTCPLVSLVISRGRLSPIIAQVRLSSEYLRLYKYLAEAIVEMGLFLYDIFGDYPWFQVLQVDLYADVVKWDILQANWQECFISRAVGDEGRPPMKLCQSMGLMRFADGRSALKRWTLASILLRYHAVFINRQRDQAEITCR